MTNVRGNPLREQRKVVITDEEFADLLNHAEAIEDEFFRKRAKTILCVLRLTGKRREEVARLEINDVKVENNLLNSHSLWKRRGKAQF